MPQKIQEFLRNNRETLLICLIYSAAYLPMAVNGWFFFDDAVTAGFRQNLESLLLTYREIGWFLAWPAYLHALFFLPGEQAGLFLERALVFALYLGSALCLNSVLKVLRAIGDRERLFVVLLFAVLPVNTARIAVSNMNYAVSYFLFFLGAYCLAAYLRRPGNLSLRLCSLAAFFVSFSTNSLLVFYAAVLLFILLFEAERPGGGLMRGLRRAPAYADFIVLPAVFWLVLRLFFPPYGNYSDQNQLTLQGLLGWTRLLPLLRSYVKSAVFDAFLVRGAAAVLLALSLAWLVEKIRTEKEGFTSPYAYPAVIAAGVLLVLAGAFPYLAVSKYPVDFSWNSRHALLLPLGLSLLLVYGTVALVKLFSFHRVVSTFLLSLLTVTYAGASNRAYSRFLREWVKQAAIVEYLKSSDIAKNGGTLVFDDRTKEAYDGFPQETYRFYNWSALLNVAFNDQRRAGFNSASYAEELDRFLKIPEKNRGQYFMADYKPGGRAVKVYILPSSRGTREPGSAGRSFRALAAGLPREELRTVIQVNFAPLPSGGGNISATAK
ncbi:MAG: hypothetical protein HY550_00560 [Elusimicrobia bacterium]|nr:hypothetical protein [Elusimicrobiota bacterium]